MSKRIISEVGQAYDQHEIAQYFTGNEPGRDGNNFYLLPIIMHFLREHTKESKQPFDYLEVGSGGGQTLARVVTELNPASVTVVEPSQAMMQATLTRPELRHAETQGLVVTGHLATFQEVLKVGFLADSGYDAIVSMLVAEFMTGLESEEHPQRLEAYVYELLRKISEDGILVVADVVNPVEEKNIGKLIFQSLVQIGQSYAQLGLMTPWVRIIKGLKFYKVNVEPKFLELNNQFYDSYQFSNEDWQRLAADLQAQGYEVDILNMGLQVRVLAVRRKK